ncbi:hypothetical protein Fuma_05082 [Fuerstiella marisgermanici]|uniref:Uncharacterized protein n=1 Tax=Fuerstiella marisgermanici TaxID=1891926 RepID=A0A1P8WMY8_9PLAN|nr:hypothetical protein Fuma_05082 [Fuerstiella marisgermanici]
MCYRPVAAFMKNFKRTSEARSGRCSRLLGRGDLPWDSPEFLRFDHSAGFLAKSTTSLWADASRGSPKTRLGCFISKVSEYTGRSPDC